MTTFSIRELKERIEEVRSRAEATVRFGLRSGSVWELRRAGMAVAVEVALGRQPRSPATLYRYHARNTPDKPALVWHDHVRTFAEVDAEMNAVTAALARRGVRRGATVALMTRKPRQ